MLFWNGWTSEELTCIVWVWLNDSSVLDVVQPLFHGSCDDLFYEILLVCMDHMRAQAKKSVLLSAVLLWVDINVCLVWLAVAALYWMWVV